MQDALRSPRLPWTHFYIAINLYNNEEVVRPLTASLATLIDVYLAPLFGPGSIFVSVFANGSKDNTTRLLNEVMLPELQSRRVGISMVSNGTCFGFHRKPEKMDRIEWMAEVRNSALKPLYEHGGKVFSASQFHNYTQDTATGDVASLNSMNAPSAPPHSTAVMFFNDVLFNADDAAALLLTAQGDYDLSCGLDFYNSFYDTWVTRDASGHLFSAFPPYGVDAATQLAFAKGDAAPVRCCWNGLAIIRASTFLTSNVRFRHNSKGATCYASECLLMCEDMLRLGHKRIFINPRVKVAYEEYYFKMHNADGFFTSRLYFSLMWWLRFWSWSSYRSLFFSDLPENQLSCVNPADLKGHTLQYYLVMLAVCGGAWAACRRYFIPLKQKAVRLWHSALSLFWFRGDDDDVASTDAPSDALSTPTRVKFRRPFTISV